jgi:hypothetical protein
MLSVVPAFAGTTSSVNARIGQFTSFQIVSGRTALVIGCFPAARKRRLDDALL